MSFTDHVLSIQDLYERQLKSWGITHDEAKELGLELLTGEQVYEKIGQRVGPAIRIPYFDIDGAALDFDRFRLLTPTQDRKYTQISRSGARVYFGKALPWRAICNDPSSPLIITEGELKQFALFKELKHLGLNIAPLALQGVYSFGGKNMPMLSEMLGIKWRGRIVYILFDYDGGAHRQPKPHVARAAVTLAIKLRGMGADVRICDLGELAPEAGKKCAIDDFLQSGGSLPDVLAGSFTFTSERDDPESLLHEFSARFAFYQGDVVDTETGLVLPFSKSKVQLGHLRVEVLAPTAANPTKTKIAELLDMYRVWPKKTMLNGLGMYPRYQGMPITPDGCFNYFRDYEHAPIDGDVSTYLDFCTEFFSADPSFQHFFHDWVAQIVQKPWQKNYTIVEFVSPNEGVGKSFLGELVAMMLGIGTGLKEGEYSAAMIAGPNMIFDTWTGHFLGKVLGVVNEPSSDRDDHSAQLKSIATNPTLSANSKYGRAVVIDNLLNLIISTNKAYVTKTSAGSRRDAVYEPAWTDKAYILSRVKEVKAWVQHDRGLNKMMHFYATRDLSKYDPSAPAPETDAKAQAQALSMSDREVAIKHLHQWVEDHLGGVACFTAGMRDALLKELSGGLQISSQAVAREMKHYCKYTQTKVKLDGKALLCYLLQPKGAMPIEKGFTELLRTTTDAINDWLRQS